MYIQIPVKFFSYQPKELKFGTHITFGVKLELKFSINKWEVNTYSVKPILAELGKNTQLIWVELSLAWSGLFFPLSSVYRYYVITFNYFKPSKWPQSTSKVTIKYLQSNPWVLPKSIQLLKKISVINSCQLSISCQTWPLTTAKFDPKLWLIKHFKLKYFEHQLAIIWVAHLK